ncbi:outer dynein arm-docking complex subunit 2-like [Xenia sp. Carnegie-2017]|uniref:outer dynein arm-docking complex subunit 2-like n=1 Tax=Xenia sp. Carnegie-2017 TaxID=2897299 RepID=UPI001F036B1C|nr:outer dynein arm-docking complex subunit 2-like [Xenia sp. Carnegie-2017]XP_046859303.1 outer dynein arm-docking complex subunit 2-like [Xenia sp. Carnegie-2017]
MDTNRTCRGKSVKQNKSKSSTKPQYMDWSTESEEEDDRKIDLATLPASKLTSDFWQIQRLIKFVKIGNQTATLIALCALNDFDMRSEVCQMAVRDANGLTMFTNMLRTDHDKCKIATMKLLEPLTDKSKYNRRELVRAGAMHSLVDHTELSDNKDVVGWAAIVMANMSKCSLARNILKQKDGIRKLVNLLDLDESKQLSMLHSKKTFRGVSKTILARNVATSSVKALWSCCRYSKRCRIALLKTGGVKYLEKLVVLDDESLLVPVVGLIQECCIEKNFRKAVQHTSVIETVVNHLKRENLELKTYCALAIFKCGEEKNTRDIVFQGDAVLPLMDMLTLKENKALTAATGALWKCARSVENAKRFLQLDVMHKLINYIQHDEWKYEIQAHAVGTVAELTRLSQGSSELYNCDGCEALISMLGHPNKEILKGIAQAIYNSSEDEQCKIKFKQMDAIRLLWTLLKSFDDKVIVNAAWALYVLIEDEQNDAENIRSFVGGLEVLVNLLKSESTEVLTAVCAVISKVAMNYENAGIISEYDVAPLLAKLTNINDEGVKRYLAEAIASCSVFGSNAIAFRNLGVVSKIVKYLHIQDTLLQEASVRALYHLSRDPANCVIIHKNGGVKLLLEMVGSNDPDLQEKAASCLTNIRQLAIQMKDTKS